MLNESDTAEKKVGMPENDETKSKELVKMPAANDSSAAGGPIRTPVDLARALNVAGDPLTPTGDPFGVSEPATTFCGIEREHDRHPWGPPASPATCPGFEPAPADDLGSYADMFADYLAEQRHWIGAAQQPLVFHIRKLCRKLDADDDAPASYASAYLQAISRLERMRPGSKAPAGSDGDLPGQGSIFDEL